VHDVAFLIELDDLRTARAAQDARRVVAAANLVALGDGAAVDEPDVVVRGFDREPRSPAACSSGWAAAWARTDPP
jgi:hypothetical protein